MIDSLLGSAEEEEAWFRDSEVGEEEEEGGDIESILEVETESKRRLPASRMTTVARPPARVRVPMPKKRQLSAVGHGVLLPTIPLSFLDSTERTKEKMLDVTGDICGGRGGELGRRLEAWLCASGNGDD